MILAALPEKSPTVGLICPSAIFTLQCIACRHGFATRAIPHRQPVTAKICLTSYNIDFVDIGGKYFSFISACTAQSRGKTLPWMNTNLSPDERASLVVKAMTLDEKVQMLHGTGMEGLSPMSPHRRR